MKKTWPQLSFDELEDTVTTVHLWAQIVGKIRLVKMPWINHSWHVTLYLTPQGITTGSMPYDKGLFQIDFDFVAHRLHIVTSNGSAVQFPLYACTIADFYKELMEKLSMLGIEAIIYAKPNELPVAIPFKQDTLHRTYDAHQMHNLWKAWTCMYPVFVAFRARFIGKCSPVHLFWGAFDLAVTRFSGRKAPAHPGGMPNIPLNVMQEAYSHEVSSCGFWAGSKDFPYPAFYAYCYPAPAAFEKQLVLPAAAFYSNGMGEFFLKYDAVINAPNPEAYLMEFLQTSYDAAARTGNWDRAALEANLTGYKRHYANDNGGAV